MRAISRIITGLALALCLAGCGKSKPADDHIFGVARGQQLSTLKDVRPLNEAPLINYAFTPTEPDPAFSDYALLAGPTVGVCTVRGHGTGMTQTGLDALRDKLKDKYGAPGFSAETGSYFWPANAGEPLEGTRLATIVLSYFASEVSLTYTFNNAAACSHELEVQAEQGDGE